MAALKFKRLVICETRFAFFLSATFFSLFSLSLCRVTPVWSALSDHLVSKERRETEVFQGPKVHPVARATVWVIDVSIPLQVSGASFLSPPSPISAPPLLSGSSPGHLLMIRRQWGRAGRVRGEEVVEKVSPLAVSCKTFFMPHVFYFYLISLVTLQAAAWMGRVRWQIHPDCPQWLVSFLTGN